VLKSSKIYVAGHTGLLGSAILKRLTEKSYHNIIIRTHQELELTDSVSAEVLFAKEKPEVVFMAAGRAGNLNRCITHPATLYFENSMIQNNVFAASCKYGVQHLVYFGSSCIYPENAIQPINEESLFNGPLEEATSGYAAAKLSGVLACKAYNNEYFNGKCRFIPIIPNTVYGPNDHFDLQYSHVFSALIGRFFRANKTGTKKVILWGSGNPKREFIFNEDIADAAIFLVDNSESIENNHYNVGTSVETSIKDLALMISRALNYKGEIVWDKSKPDGRPSKLIDSSRIRNLGWSHNININEGLDLTLEWYKKNYG